MKGRTMILYTGYAIGENGTLRVRTEHFTTRIAATQWLRNIDFQSAIGGTDYETRVAIAYDTDTEARWVVDYHHGISVNDDAIIADATEGNEITVNIDTIVSINDSPCIAEQWSGIEQGDAVVIWANRKIYLDGVVAAITADAMVVSVCSIG